MKALPTLPFLEMSLNILKSLLLSISFPIFFFSTSSFASDELRSFDSTVFQISGVHSSRGPYSGQLQIMTSSELLPIHEAESNPKMNKEIQASPTVSALAYKAIRIIEYENFRYKNLKVQEVWEGKGIRTPDGIKVLFNLGHSGFLLQVGEEKRQELASQMSVTLIADYKWQAPTEFLDHNNEKFSEQILSVQENSTNQKLETPNLIWKNERQLIDANGKSGVPWLVRQAMNLSKWLSNYNDAAIVQQNQSEDIHKKELQYLVFDPTDYNFYQTHPNELRVVNKIMDPINLAEAKLRRDAYAFSLEQKTTAFQNAINQFHLNELGMIGVAAFNSQGQFLGVQPEGDSALWTGMYAGAQAMRFLKTQDPEALLEYKKSLRALLDLMDISDDPKEFARTMALKSSQPNWDSNWREGSGRFAGRMWLCCGNNDMVKGLTHAMMWGKLVLSEKDSDLLLELKQKSQRLLNLEVMKKKKQNVPLAYGLVALYDPTNTNIKSYRDSFNSLWVKLAGFSWDATFYWKGLADWSGVNLNVVNTITHIMLADQLKQTDIRDQWRERLMDSWGTYAPVRHSLLSYAANQFAYKFGTRGNKFKRLYSEQNFQDVLQFADWTLREYPLPQSFESIRFDHSIQPQWALSAQARLFWKVLESPRPPAEYFVYSAYSYPVFESASLTSNFIWKDQYFNFKGEKGYGMPNPGVDYLYAYYLRGGWQ